MTARFSRRDALLRTAATAAASAMPGVLRSGMAAPFGAAARSGELDAALKKSVEAADVPGVVAMAATAQSVIYQGAFGVRGAGAAAKMSDNTVFRIASMIKLLTSVAAMQLVEAGKLGLDDPAERLDPTLASQQVLLGFDEKGAPQLRPAQKPITLRNLLSHTSGLSYQLWDANLARYLKRSRNDPALPRMPLMFDPDTGWAYGGSLDRVGRMVEVVSGKTLDRYFRDHICVPLGMKDTAFVITEQQRAREASLHFRKVDGTLVRQPIEKRTPPKVFSGGGGIYSTAPDYLTLLQALLNGGNLAGKAILRPETVALMSANQIGNIEAGVMKTTNPALSNDVDFFPGVRLRWGLGHMINLDPVREGR
jgi:methyl acetate hydrolase